jgi:hypothetical protein
VGFGFDTMAPMLNSTPLIVEFAPYMAHFPKPLYLYKSINATPEFGDIHSIDASDLTGGVTYFIDRGSPLPDVLS